MKLHSGVDSVIEGNLIRNSKREAIWLDNTTPGARITRNVLINNPVRALFIELGYGPVLIDNNILINTQIALQDSGGSFLAHNLVINSPKPVITGNHIRTATIYTPHTMEHGGMRGDPHVTNTVDQTPFTVTEVPLITPERLGPVQHTGAMIPEAVTTDFYGNLVNTPHPLPGPFAELVNGRNSFTVWTKPLASEPEAPPMETVTIIDHFAGAEPWSKVYAMTDDGNYKISTFIN